MSYQKGSRVFGEIHDQPRAWRQVLEQLAGQREDLGGWLKAENFGQVVLVASSDSWHVALSAARILHLVSGLNSVAVHASEVLYARRAPYDSRIKTLTLALARPDEAEEVGWALDKLRALDPKSRVLCLEVGAPALQAAAHRGLAFPDLHEETRSGTRSVSSLLLACMGLTAWIAGRDALWQELVRLPDLVDFQRWQPRIQAAAQVKPAHLVFLGSGPYYGVACQGALHVRELAAIPTEHQHALEYRHGHHGSLTNLQMVVGLISRTFRVADERVLSELAFTRAQRLAVTEEAGSPLQARVDHVFEFRSGVSEISRVLLSLPVLQLFAFYLAISKGVNPDQPKHPEHHVLKLKEIPGAPPAAS